VTDVRGFLSGDAVDVAPRLLGWRLTSTSDEGVVAVELTEVEAYGGEADPASHAFRGRTPRNAVMFGEAGHVYVYRSHGLHWCMNIVTGSPGVASAVLLRAGRVVEGVDLAQLRRGERVSLTGLARGPGNLGSALGLSLADGGVDLLADGRATLSRPRSPGSVEPERIVCGPRVGVSVAHDVPWRFWIEGDPSVSAYRRSPRARP
jgi:DNA-3-methyladenine glycosylase